MTTPRNGASGRDRLQAALDREEIPLRLLSGMEYYLDEFFVSQVEEILPLGDSRLVLVEALSQGNIGVVGEGSSG